MNVIVIDLVCMTFKMNNIDFPLSTDNKHAIVMEPTIKSISFMKFLKKSAIALLRSNKYKPKSIKTEGFYVDNILIR